MRQLARKMQFLRFAPALALIAAAGPAYALKPGTHADITQAACTATGLPRDFCTRTATEDYNTDSREWDDLRAHAQIDGNETACTAADLAATRVWQLGVDIRVSLWAVHTAGGDENVAASASALGRALHTVQDNCAHHGMPNPQHAWFSISDFCDGTKLSPDIQDDALACARTESAAIMTIAAAAIGDSGMNVVGWLDARSCPPSPNSNPHTNSPTPICQARFLPGPIDACSFLATAADWDGIDRTWKNPVVVSALRRAFEAGVSGQVAPGPMCGGDETVLSSAVSAPMLDVSGGPSSCARSKIFCLGKADDGDNPFADDAAPTSDAGGGCSVAGDRTGLVGLLLACGVALRRRRA